MQHRLSSWRLSTAVAIVTAAAAAGANGPRFYPDDPIARYPETQDASKVMARAYSLSYEMLLDQFAEPGDPNPSHALSVNTIDEVPDSSWFTNRIGVRDLTLDELRTGPDTTAEPAPRPWTIVSGKSDGVTPGFTIRDARGDIYFIKFDPKDWPRMATGTEVAATKIFHALGYNVPENYIVQVRREDLRVGEGARYRPRGNPQAREFRESDIDRLLRVAGREADGRYRVVASKALPGKPLGGFRYFGTRPDDPNDVIPHEHRRELRGLRVFSAWVNHVDVKDINTLDMLVTANGRSVVRHHLIDFGSTMGSAATGPRDPIEGWEYLYEGSTLLKSLVTLGLYVRPWQTVDYRTYREIGRIEADRFDPEAWRPRVPNQAFLRSQPDDLFWGARLVMRFSDEMIRAVVDTGRFGNPEAEQHLAGVLSRRRDAIGRAWLTGINPVYKPALEGGLLRFSNPAVDYRLAGPPEGWRAEWAGFDNMTGAVTPIGGPVFSSSTTIEAPTGLPDAEGRYLRVAIAAQKPPHESWTRPVHAYFVRTPGAWKLVGFERTPPRSEVR